MLALPFAVNLIKLAALFHENYTHDPTDKLNREFRSRIHRRLRENIILEIYNSTRGERAIKEWKLPSAFSVKEVRSSNVFDKKLIYGAEEERKGTFSKRRKGRENITLYNLEQLRKKEVPSGSIFVKESGSNETSL